MKKKESTEWLWFFSVYATVWITEYILRSVYHFRGDDPIYRRVAMCVVAIFILGYMFYLWRADLAGFLKRVLIAVPFALTFAIFMIMVTRTLVSILFGLPMYGLLLFKTPSWKQHFSVTLVLASILVVALKFSYSMLNPLIPQEMWLYQNFFPMVSIVFIGFFYGLYLRKVGDGETIDLHAIFIRILKFVAVFSFYTAAWLTLQQFDERYRISLSTNLIASGVLTIVFLVICYLFDLFPIERKKKTKKKSKLDELQSQLNDVYLKEREKSKSSSD